MSQTLNINQTAITPVVGMIDINTMESGIFTAIVDSTQATALVAGQPVKFVTTNTGPYPKVVAAAQGDVACGMVAYITKDSSFVAGDKLDIAFFGGLVIFQQATAVAITPGTQVESDSTGLLIQAYSSHPVRGYALDYFAASGVARIIQLGILQSA